MEPSSDTPARPETTTGSSDDETTLVLRVLLGDLSPEQACEHAQISGAELTEWIRKHRRAARRSLDERIAAVLTAHGLEKDDFVLAGNLETMALSDLLEAINLGHKNAHIRIEHGGRSGHLWCADGDVIDAQWDGLVGTAAVYALLGLREGRLQAEFSSVTRERTVVTPTRALLVEFARREDERGLLAAAASEPPLALPTNLDEWGVPAAASHSAARPSDISVPPIVPSSPAGRWLPQPVQRYGVVPLAAAALVATFVLAFGAGSWRGQLRARAAERALASQQPEHARLSMALCGPSLLLLPAGAGTPADLPAGDPEAVQKPFCLAREVVSTAEYQACVSDQRCDAIASEAGGSGQGGAARCNAGQPGREQEPINCVTQLQARQYCEWRGQRLPLPNEWEFAWRWARSVAGGQDASSATASTLRLGDVSEWTWGSMPRGTTAAEGTHNELYAVLGGKTQWDWAAAQPRRVYMSAGSQGRNLGFRCALGLASSALTGADSPSLARSAEPRAP